MLSLFGLTVRVRGVVLISYAQSLWSHRGGEGGVVLTIDGKCLCSHSEGEGEVVITSETADLFGLNIEGEQGVVLTSDGQSLWSSDEWGVVLMSETAGLSGCSVRVRGEWS